MKKIVVVTGGSRGIGAATAHGAAQQGYDVCVNYHRDRDAAEAVARGVRALGRRAITVQADVSNEGDVMRLFAQVDADLGRVTALVNNAGILEQQMRIEGMDAVRLNRIFAVNVTGSFICAREAVRRMSTKHGGAGGAIVTVIVGLIKNAMTGQKAG